MQTLNDGQCYKNILPTYSQKTLSLWQAGFSGVLVFFNHFTVKMIQLEETPLDFQSVESLISAKIMPHQVVM